MAAATSPIVDPALISIEEYLCTSYDPDCDFVEGRIEERNVGEDEHSAIQGELSVWFGIHRKEWKIKVRPELRTRVSKTTVRVPDFCLIPEDAPRERVRVTPALLAVEILSPEDRLPRVIPRLNDFLAMGVQNLWLIDPIERVAYTYTAQGLQLAEGPRLTLLDSPIYIDLAELFSALDE